MYIYETLRLVELLSLGMGSSATDERLLVSLFTARCSQLAVSSGGWGGERREEACARGWRQSALTRRIYRGGFTDSTGGVISALGYLPLWGNSKLYLRVRSLPGVHPKLPFSHILDSTGSVCEGAGGGRTCVLRALDVLGARWHAPAHKTAGAMVSRCGGSEEREVGQAVGRVRASCVRAEVEGVCVLCVACARGVRRVLCAAA